MIKDFKNYEEIKNATGRIRGENIEEKDLTLIFFNKFLEENYNLSGRDTIEFSIYDMDDNLLLWSVKEPPYEIYDQFSPSKLILSPGDDLRNNNFQRGQYRVVYDFYRDELGSPSIGLRDRGKVFIDEISPSRTEVRVLPVKKDVAGLDAIFASEFFNFSNPGVGKLEFNNRFSAAMKRLRRRQVEAALGDDDALINLVSPQYISLRDTTIEHVAAAIDAYESNLQDILSKNEQRQIINSVHEGVWNEVFNEGWDQGKLLQAFSDLTTLINSFTFQDPDAKTGDFYLNFGNGCQFLITNWANDNITYSEAPNSIVFKLYEKLSNDIKVKDQLWVSRQITPSVIEKVFLLGADDIQEQGRVLRPANWGVEVAGMTGRGTGFETWTSLISTEASTSQQLIDHYFSGSDVGDVALNIDYSDYYNFIHFGSAEERLKNFKYKLEVIDQYNENIKKTTTYTSSFAPSSFVSQSVAGFRQQIRQTLNTFDSYERHLYYISGSSYSGSLLNGQYLTNAINEWPKRNRYEPYELYELTSSVATNWYDTQLAIAQRVDRDNIYSFVNNMPVYLSVEEDNEDYLTFMYMIGQHFDILYSYINHLTDVANRDESLYDGLAKDLTYNVAKSMGFDIKGGQDNTELWKYAFGYADTGSYSVYGTGSAVSVTGSGETHMSSEEASKEIWRRLLNNIPYMLKTKGTSRAVKALLACYGIPTSLLTIREYGGPDPRDYPNFEDKSAWIFDDFVYAIDFEGSQSVSATWTDYTQSMKPQTIEFRFAAAPTTTKATQSLFNTNNFAINLVKANKAGYGHLEIIDGANRALTEQYQYFDGEFNSVMLRTYNTASDSMGWIHELFTKKAEVDHVIWESSASIPTGSDYDTNSTFYIGGDASITFGQQFTGSMQEFKFYQTALSESTFDNHVRWPKSYNSNISTDTYYDLTLRYSFDNPKNHNLDTVVTDTKANQSANPGVIPGSAIGFDSEINYHSITEEYSAITPLLGAGRFINNKVRLEDNEIAYGQLSVGKRVEKSGFDRAPVDSAKLGIYFTPQDAINKDIVGTYAGLDLLGYIGDPRDKFADTYNDLDELNNFYWSKYTDRPDHNSFIRVLNNYDQSFFDQLKRLLPARAKPIIGTLLEPHILERYKYKWSPVGEERNDYQTHLNRVTEPTFSTAYPTYDTAILQVTSIEEAEYLDKFVELDLGLWNKSRYFQQTPVIVTEESLAGAGSKQAAMGFAPGIYKGTGSLFVPGQVDDQQSIDMIWPVQDNPTYNWSIFQTKRQVFEYVSSSIDDTGATTYRQYQYHTGSSGEKVLSKYHYVYDMYPGNWYLQYRELQSRIWYNGTMNTKDTTLDGKDPVEISFTNPNKLKTTDQGPSKITVE
jgi:hypothetical protein